MPFYGEVPQWTVDPTGDPLPIAVAAALILIGKMKDREK